MTAWLILKRLYAPHDNTGMIYMRGLPPQEEADTKDKEPMTRSFKDSFARIGGAIAQEYKDHGRLRGISTEILNNAFDAGEKLGDAVRKYAPQAADTAKTQGERAANAAKAQGEKAVKAAKEYGDQAISKVRQYGGDVAEQAGAAFSKAGENVRNAISSDEQENQQNDAVPADDASTAENASADAETGGNADNGQSADAGQDSADEEPSESRDYGINPDDAQDAIARIDAQIADKSKELEHVCQQIDSEQAKQSPDPSILEDLEDRKSNVKSSIEYLEESKKAFRESTVPESNE